MSSTILGFLCRNSEVVRTLTTGMAMAAGMGNIIVQKRSAQVLLHPFNLNGYNNYNTTCSSIRKNNCNYFYYFSASGLLQQDPLRHRFSYCCCSASSVSPPPPHSHHNKVNNQHKYVVQDDDNDEDIHALFQILPCDLRYTLVHDPNQSQLLEVILDLGKLPQACYAGDFGRRFLRNTEVTIEELECAQNAIGNFGDDNRAGIQGTLHRISAIRSRKGQVIGLTCRVGRAIQGHVSMVRDLLDFSENILFVGRPGVGKTTVMREISRVLSDELQKRVVIVDTSNEIGGDGDVPHPAIGSARRLQVPNPSMQHLVMIEAVENHMPEVIIIDEIGTDSEVNACRTIAERGVMLIGTAHGAGLENIVKNPTLANLIGGVKSVTIGDQEARIRNSKKIILEREASPTFPFLIEVRERHYWVIHRTGRSVDALLCGRKPMVEIRKRDGHFKIMIERWKIEG